MLKEKINSGLIEMEVPFEKELKANYSKAKTQFLHSKKCKELRESRHAKFNKVRVLYWNLMFLLGGIVVVSVGRILYDIIRILKMQ